MTRCSGERAARRLRRGEPVSHRRRIVAHHPADFSKTRCN